ncbi:hypothetical protein F4777DRAFT_554574 [Nemania sp. FL0916]|nr:hypothetical protein F4777DRAFT_554574 [Nemania sp. FL0916]
MGAYSNSDSDSPTFFGPVSRSAPKTDELPLWYPDGKACGNRQSTLALRNDPLTKRTESSTRDLISNISATISLLSSWFVGPLIASSAGSSVYCSGPTSLRSSIPHPIPFYLVDTPPLQRVTVVFHIFCLSSLVFCRTRKADPYQTATIIIVMLLGISLDLLVAFFINSYSDIARLGMSITARSTPILASETAPTIAFLKGDISSACHQKNPIASQGILMNLIAEETLILPFLLSLGAIISAIWHRRTFSVREGAKARFGYN